MSIVDAPAPHPVTETEGHAPDVAEQLETAIRDVRNAQDDYGRRVVDLARLVQERNGNSEELPGPVAEAMTALYAIDRELSEEAIVLLDRLTAMAGGATGKNRMSDLGRAVRLSGIANIGADDPVELTAMKTRFAQLKEIDERRFEAGFLAESFGRIEPEIDSFFKSGTRLDEAEEIVLAACPAAIEA